MLQAFYAQFGDIVDIVLMNIVFEVNCNHSAENVANLLAMFFIFSQEHLGCQSFAVPGAYIKSYHAKSHLQ